MVIFATHTLKYSYSKRYATGCQGTIQQEMSVTCQLGRTGDMPTGNETKSFLLQFLNMHFCQSPNGQTNRKCTPIWQLAETVYYILPVLCVAKLFIPPRSLFRSYNACIHFVVLKLCAVGIGKVFGCRLLASDLESLMLLFNLLIQ